MSMAVILTIFVIWSDTSKRKIRKRIRMGVAIITIVGIFLSWLLALLLNYPLGIRMVPIVIIQIIVATILLKGLKE